MENSVLKIKKIDKKYAKIVKDIIVSAYTPLLNKYHDEKENPANKSIEAIVFDLQRKKSDAFLLLHENTEIGYVRVGQRNEREYSLADLAIMPKYQGKGYAQFFIQELEKIYSDAQIWSLVTIAEEEKDCHLYEKMGYTRKQILQEVNEKSIIYSI
jgi:ribosomal protein S18 acetylase RimI-like enzyme